MILQKIIPNLNIQPEYTAFVESFKTQLVNAFNDTIHSLYICGSIPKGTATPYVSDADFTLLVKNPEDIDRCKLREIKAQTLMDFPLVTKIDTTICTFNDIHTKPNEWGFWIKIVCVNIYGDDYGTFIPPIEISPQFIIDLNADVKESIDRVNHALLNTEDHKLKCQYIKGYSKRLIRALYTLILMDVGVWKDDISEMTELIIQFTDIRPEVMQALYACYLNSDQSVKDFKKKADAVYAYFEKHFEALSYSS